MCAENESLVKNEDNGNLEDSFSVLDTLIRKKAEIENDIVELQKQCDRDIHDIQESNAKKTKKYRHSRILLKICLILINFAILAFVSYLLFYPQSPIAGLFASVDASVGAALSVCIIVPVFLLIAMNIVLICLCVPVNECRCQKNPCHVKKPSKAEEKKLKEFDAKVADYQNKIQETQDEIERIKQTIKRTNTAEEAAEENTCGQNNTDTDTDTKADSDQDAVFDT